MFPKIRKIPVKKCASLQYASFYTTNFNGIDIMVKLSCTNDMLVNLNFSYSNFSKTISMHKQPYMFNPLSERRITQIKGQYQSYRNNPASYTGKTQYKDPFTADNTNFKDEFILPKEVVNMMAIMMIQYNEEFPPNPEVYKAPPLTTLYILENKDTKYFNIIFLINDEDENEFINKDKYYVVFSDICNNKLFVIEKIIFEFNRIENIESTRTEITEQVIKYLKESNY